MTTNLPKLKASVRLFEDCSDRPTRVLAFAELTIADAFVIKGLRVLQHVDPLTRVGDEAPFVVFPAEKGRGASSDRWFDVAHPTRQEARDAAVAAVLDAYARARADAGDRG